KWEGADGRVDIMTAIHAEYTNNDESVKKCIEQSEKLDTRIHIHLSETEKEVKDCYARHGCSPVEYFEKLNLFSRKVLAAHCVYLDDNDIDILARNNVHVAHNPCSNLKLASGIAPIPAMMDKGINISIGTDGAGSNNALDVWRDMYVASILHKGANREPGAINAIDALKMATINGANALGVNAGSLTVGKKADLIIVNTDDLWFNPLNELEKLLVYSGTRARVLVTVVDGKIVFRNNEFLKIDREEVIYNVNKIRSKYIS
ncbi:MAG TPA: amidohydrolase family protein, partial [Clostridia bacterium]|nr:amidohydrolase family protein [Clostridia bacterium]